MKICRKLLVVLLSMALLLGIAASGVGALTGGKHWVGSWSAGMTDISITLLEGLEPTQAQTTQPDTTEEATVTQAETKAADSTMEAEETQAEMPEIAGTGDSLVAGGAALAALAACSLLIVTRKKQ